MTRGHSLKTIKKNQTKKPTHSRNKRKDYRSEKEKSLTKRNDRKRHFQEMNDFVSDTFRTDISDRFDRCPSKILEFLNPQCQWITLEKTRICSSEPDWCFYMYYRSLKYN